jgi:hypothetical protein
LGSQGVPPLFVGSPKSISGSDRIDELGINGRICCGQQLAAAAALSETTSPAIPKSIAIVIGHRTGGRRRCTRGRDSVGSDGHGSPRRSASVEDARSLAHQVDPGNTGNTEFIAHRWTEQRWPLRSTDGPTVS